MQCIVKDDMGQWLIGLVYLIIWQSGWASEKTTGRHPLALLALSFCMAGELNG